VKLKTKHIEHVLTYSYVALLWLWTLAVRTEQYGFILYPMVSLEFFIDIILPAALFPWG